MEDSVEETSNISNDQIVEEQDVINPQTLDVANSLNEKKEEIQDTTNEIEPNLESKINVERTLYTIPSTWNMNLAGFSRCNSGDRQILGVYLAAGQNIKARILSADNQISVGFMANDSWKEGSMNIPNNGEWITLSNSKNGVNYDSVPVLTSTILKRNDINIHKTFKIELEYDGTIQPLNYYHYKDDEGEFRQKWKTSKNTYGVVENEVLTIITPFADIDKMVNHNLYGNSFKTFDQFLEYYQKVVDKMDEYVGLDLNPEKLTDQNVRTKYLVKANAHGAGAAYYAGHHVGINNSSISSFFQMNWGGLHELAHGYQGNLGKGTMGLGETGNNIIGHYIQVDKDIYFYPGDWLGNLSTTENNRNANRENGGTWNSNEVGTRLYMIVNLFDTFEGGTTYSKIFSWYREHLNNHTLLVDANSNQNIYALALADIYHVNIIPYMEAWGLDIANNVKDEIYSKDYPMLSILKDTVNDSSLEQILEGENINRKYSLVTNDILEKYNVTGNLSIHIEIKNFSDIKGKILRIKSGNNIIKQIEITSPNVEIEDLPVGNYYIQMPINNEYNQDHFPVYIKEGVKNSYTYSYKIIDDVQYDNYLRMDILSYYFNTIGCRLTFKDAYTKVRIEYPNGASMHGGEYVRIYDQDGKLISDDSVNGTYFDYNQGAHDVEIKPGYVVEVYYPDRYASKVKFYSTLTGKEVTTLRAPNKKTQYIVMSNGLRVDGMSEAEVDELSYQNLKAKLIEIIEAYKNQVIDEELNNRIKNFKVKSDVLAAYNSLREEDQKPYFEFVYRIKRGGLPYIISSSETYEYSIGSNIDLYSLIEVNDNEDGKLKISKSNTKIHTNLNVYKSGNYPVTYSVMDSDKNVSMHKIQIVIKDDSKKDNSSEDHMNKNQSKKENTRKHTVSITKKDRSKESTKENNKMSTLQKNSNVVKKEKQRKRKTNNVKQTKKAHKLDVDSKKNSKEMKNVVDYWLDGEYNAFEVVIVLFCMVGMSSILAYLRSKR